MNFENKPSEPPAQETSINAENAERDADRKANLEAFCATAIRASETLKPEVKEYLEAYVRQQSFGQWLMCDGKNVVFDGFSRDDAHRQIVAYFLVLAPDKDGKQNEATDEIPMPEWME